MKILIDCCGFIPGKAFGAQTYIEGIISGITNGGEHIHVVASMEACMHLKKINNQIKFLPIKISKNPAMRLFTVKYFINKLVSKYGIDVVFSPLNLTPKYNAVTILTVHDMINDYFIRNYKLKLSEIIVAVVKNILVKKSIRNADIIFTPSEFTKSHILCATNCNFDNIFPVHHGIMDLVPIPVRLPSSVQYKYSIFLPSHRGRHKNVQVVYELLDYMYTNDYDLYKELVFIISGCDIIHRCKNRKSTTRDHEDKFINLGYLSASQIKYIYQKVNAVLFPSRYEGFGLPIIEGLYNKLPVICSDIPVFREVGGDNVHYFESRSYRQLYQIIKKTKLSFTTTSCTLEYRSWENVWNEMLAYISKNK